MLDFTPDSSPITVPNNQDITKGEADVFYRAEQAFLPPGKNFSDLTPEELEELKIKYRFDYLRPSTYQGTTAVDFTGKGNML